MSADITELPYKSLRVSGQGPVLRVELNSPETGNALTVAILDDLLELLDSLNGRPEIKVLVLSGAGDHFCLGADRTEFQDSLAADPSGACLRVIADKGRRVCDALESANAVTIARLQGKVIGAGLALAVFCDLRVGTDTCRFRLPELALGIPPAWGGVLPRLIAEAGAARIRELILTGAPFDAATAHDLSILHKVAPADQLDAVIEAWVNPLVRRPPGALTIAKLMLSAHSRANRLTDGTLFDAQLLSASQANQALIGKS